MNTNSIECAQSILIYETNIKGDFEYINNKYNLIKHSDIYLILINVVILHLTITMTGKVQEFPR